VTYARCVRDAAHEAGDLAHPPALEAAAPSVGVNLIRAAIESAFGALRGDPKSGLVTMADVFVAEHCSPFTNLRPGAGFSQLQPFPTPRASS
jgi:hypothetical protein